MLKPAIIECKKFFDSAELAMPHRILRAPQAVPLHLEKEKIIEFGIIFTMIDIRI
jgi:hypothetical protein